ncbi:MAG: CDP-diacylglycerol--glycerol-3-phosphate 3-phosphatidyltransferase [Acidimicrobiia bacterium]
MSLPNLLGVIRILMTPIVMVLVLAGGRTPHAAVIAAVLFVVAAATDFLDGYLARRWNIGTVLGTFLDSIADKLLVTGALLALVSNTRVSVWAALIIIAREMFVMTLRGLVAIEGHVVRPSALGKAKANVQYLAIVLAILRPFQQIGGLYLDQWVMWFAVALTIISGWGYVRAFSTIVRTVDS